jgi:hypothetical protein
VEMHRMQLIENEFEIRKQRGYGKRLDDDV